MSPTVTAQRDAILAASLDLLASGGPQALRVRDIAEAAGCTTMTVYSRFGGKDGVLEAIYIDGFGRFAEALNAAVDDAGDSALEQSQRLCAAYRTWALANTGSYRMMFTEAVPGFAPSDDAVVVALGAFQILLDLVESLQVQGHVVDCDPHEIAWALWGSSHGLVMLELANVHPLETGDSQSLYETSTAAVIRGFAPG